MGNMERVMKPSSGIMILFMLLFWTACNQDYAPKPRGYFRIDLPEKAYQEYKSDCPYTFNYPVYAKITPDSIDRNANPCWIDIVYPRFNGRIHVSYMPVHSKAELNGMAEDAYKLVYKNVVKATEISALTITYPANKVYGVSYNIEGNTASSVQFYLTDSTKHYLRGALYFYEQPRVDSIRPVLDFIKQDIEVMIKSFRWKN